MTEIDYIKIPLSYKKDRRFRSLRFFFIRCIAVSKAHYRNYAVLIQQTISIYVTSGSPSRVASA